MALYKWECPNCKATLRRFLDELPEVILCRECNSVLSLVINGQTIVTERLDNGAMIKALERPVNAEELTREHSTHDKASDPNDTKL